MLESCVWELRGGRKLALRPFGILGIVNTTPDSFSDGGRNLDPDTALANIVGMVVDSRGLPLIADIGGESTRPYSKPVPAEEELERALPVVKGAAELIRRGGETAPAAVSIDTVKAEVAAKALDAGAEIVNDISAWAFDPELLDVLAQYKPGYVLMHCRGNPLDMQNEPRYGNVVEEVLAFLAERLDLLVKAGLPEERVVLDPGIGFGKTLEHNLAILKNIERFRTLGRPVLIGLSNKSLWGGLLDLPVAERGNATQAATAILAARGASLHRAHDARLTAQTLRVAQALLE